MKQKRIIYRIVLTIAFMATVFSSANVFAQTFADKMITDHNYKNLLQTKDLIQITDYCIQNTRPDNSGGEGGNNLSLNEKMNLNITAYFNNYISVFSNYLDGNNPKDGDIWCSDFRKEGYTVIKNPITSIVSSIEGGINQTNINNIICGKNNKGGLFNVGFSNPNGATLPDWLKVDEDGNIEDCKKALKEAKNLNYDIGGGVTLELSLNRNFSFADYYKDEISIDDDVSKMLDALKMYLNVTQKDGSGNICYIKQVSKNTYDKKTGSKYAIRNPLTDKTEYWIPDSSGGFDKEGDSGSSIIEKTQATNIRQNPINNERISCKAAMKSLASYSDFKSGVQDVVNIKKCYNKAQDNIQTLKNIYTKLSSATGTLSKKLIQAANDLANGKEIESYTDATGKHNFINNGSVIYSTIMNDSALSQSTSAKEFANASKDFGTRVSDYYNQKSSEGSLSSAAIEDLKAQISSYTSSRSQFASIVKKVKTAIDKEKELNVSLDSMYQNYSSYNLDNSVRSEVENFYKLDENGNVTCTYNEKVGEIIKNVEDILGTSINFDEYVQNKAAEEGENSSTEGDPCYDAGVEGMSWVLCPTINNAATTIDGFEGALKTMLSIESNKMFGNDKVSYKIWETFRNIANVVLIVIFLVIIFSQLTGYGIDNYGIKKMLPKLIIMAILINLSYILCEIAVDLSNILGVGLNNLFEGMAGDAASQSTTYQIVTALLAAAAGITTGVVVVFSLMSEGGGAMVVITLVLAVLSALVVIFMFLVMVGLRMIIVVVFTVISPVALALYILPNTQNLFKKWWKVFEAALVVYPICGALYGAHFIIKAILLGQTDDGGINFFMGVAAVIAPFLPFLALPSLLKGALAGLGSVAGAVTAVGSGLRRGANRAGSAVRSTKAFKGMQERGAERSAERRATRIRNRLQNAADRRGGIGNLSDSQRRRLSQAQTLLNERTQQRAQDSVGAFVLDADTAQSRAEAARDAQEYKAARDQFANYSHDQLLVAAGLNADKNGNKINILEQQGGTQKMQALIETMEKNGMESSISSMLRQYGTDIGKNSAVMSTLANSNNKVFKAYGKKGAGQDFDSFVKGTGENSLKGYAESKGKDFINGLDDKALTEIAQSNPNAMSTDQLVAAAANANDADSLAAINDMMKNRRDISISGKQLASYNASTVKALLGNPNARSAILTASDDIAKHPELINTMDRGTREIINRLRITHGSGGRSRI